MGVEGDVEEVIEAYLETNQENNTTVSLKDFQDRSGNREVTVSSITVYGESQEKLPKTGKPFHLAFNFNNPKQYKQSEINFEFRIDDNIGQRLIWNSSKMVNTEQDLAVDKIVASMNRCILNKGTYYLTFYLRVKGLEADWIKNAFRFTVEEGLFYPSGFEVPSSQSKILTEFNYSFK